MAGEVEIFATCHREFSCELPSKNFENWCTFAKVIIKHQTAYFLQHGVVNLLFNKLCG